MTTYRVVEPFSFDRAGVPYVARRGELVTEDDVRYAGHEQFFETADSFASRAMERATAAPGEGRHLPPRYQPRAFSKPPTGEQGEQSGEQKPAGDKRRRGRQPA